VTDILGYADIVICLNIIPSENISCESGECTFSSYHTS
jgi:hypothetical protein